ncbi:hypothetical protein SADUNF_Sadunf12G0029400 [Salix dunnii]|uniref:peroxidase n=1 Tax=Salix dunnii TaxID=1413687 RepID=A0A835JI77_9ROSI|nr:hypothetical protein SADUNF_Sadunf12G0029400 [Salix dunnii]
MSITSYYTKLKSFWDELSYYNQINTCPFGKACGVAQSIMDHAEQRHLMQLLMGLDESYASTRSNILIMTPLPITRQAYSLLLQDEKQHQVAAISNKNHKSMAMLSISNNGGRKNNTINRSPYSNNNGNMSRNNQQESTHCVYCNGDTHTMEKCFSLIGFPPRHKWHGREPPIPPPRSDGNNCVHQGRNNHFNQTGARPYSFPMEQTLRLKPNDGKLLHDPTRDTTGAYTVKSDSDFIENILFPENFPCSHFVEMICPTKDRNVHMEFSESMKAIGATGVPKGYGFLKSSCSCLARAITLSVIYSLKGIGLRILVYSTSKINMKAAFIFACVVVLTVVEGCDASVLINSTANSKAEKDALPNLSLAGFDVIDEIKTELEKKCAGKVSCADTLALAARDAVSFQFQKPMWEVLTGRRDGKVSLASEALANLPSPFFNFSSLLRSFKSKGLTVHDLVVLSGAHTIGHGNCNLFSNRLYNFTGKGDQDPSLDSTYAAFLKTKCRSLSDTTTVDMDPGSSKKFDASYYVNLKQKKGLFQSDAALLTDKQSKKIVGELQKSSDFFKEFAQSMKRMGAIGVLTGNSGEIRKKCGVINS